MVTQQKLDILKHIMQIHNDKMEPYFKKSYILKNVLGIDKNDIRKYKIDKIFKCE